MNGILRYLGATLLCAPFLFPQNASVAVRVDLGSRLRPMEIDRFGVGQGGFSPEPMWDDRVAEIRAIRPRVIRLFVQEYFNLLPERGRYHWDVLDRSVDLILRAGATPMLCIAFKPKVLFPKMDQDIVEPNDWQEWDALIYNLVRHYKDRGGKGWYWEITNEGNTPSGGGTPYHFTPENYPPFYQRTVAAVLRADPEARVGGPALARLPVPYMEALVKFCASSKVPLHFVSWHRYINDPGWFATSIADVKAILAKHPGLQPQLVINEWNMSGHSDPRFQPAFIAETTYQMKRAGLDLSCYYHIRDYQVDVDAFLKFFPREYTFRQKLWWERHPVHYGLFDFQSRVRPAYFLFRLLARLTGTEVRVETDSPVVHALASNDDDLKAASVLIWNFSDSPARVALEARNAAPSMYARAYVLDSLAPNDDDNSRLRALPGAKFTGGVVRLPLELEPYGVVSVSLEVQ